MGDFDRQAPRFLTDENGNLIYPSRLASSVGDGNVTITTGGTRKQLSTSSVPCAWVIIHAVGGHIVVGGVTCDYTVASRRGIWIPKTQSQVFFVSNLNLLYVDSADNSVLVAYTYGN